jgi:hypothetical protein
MEKNTTKSCKKVANFYKCDKCDYTCTRKSSFEKHMQSKKHNTTITTLLQPKSCNTCLCGKSYNHRGSLYNHKKTCEFLKNGGFEKKSEKVEKTEKVEKDDSTMEFLLKENLEMKKMLVDVCKNLKPGTTNNNNTTNNNQFNINIFLNEQCKDAMSITDFVNSIVLKIQDTQNVGKLGYVDGISNIIVNSLNELDMCKRPIHCSDLKKEVMYIKDEDDWEQDNENKSKIKKVVEDVSKKNMLMLHEAQSEDEDINVKMVLESTGGQGDKSKKDTQIIKNIAKAVIIE